MAKGDYKSPTHFCRILGRAKRHTLVCRAANSAKRELSYHIIISNSIVMASLRFFVTILFAVIITAFFACEKDDKDDAENNANPSEEVSSIDDVVTGEAVNLSYTSVTLYGYVNNSLQNITSMGIVYGTDRDGSKLVAMGTKATASSFDPGTNNRRFSVQLTDLKPNTTYYYYAFAGIKTANNILSFTTLGELEICPDSQHPHVIDLALPSGTKWACCNVGASSPEQYGDYYAWGEKYTKNYYEAKTYQYWHDYGPPTDLGSDIAGTQYDVATEEWGKPWQLPTLEQCKELMNETTSKWTSRYGVNGRVFTGGNGNSVFLPAAGVYIQDHVSQENSGCYWSSTIENPYNAYSFRFSVYGANSGSSGSCFGNSVRPVQSK